MHKTDQVYAINVIFKILFVMLYSTFLYYDIRPFYYIYYQKIHPEIT